MEIYPIHFLLILDINKSNRFTINSHTDLHRFIEIIPGADVLSDTHFYSTDDESVQSYPVPLIRETSQIYRKEKLR